MVVSDIRSTSLLVGLLLFWHSGLAGWVRVTAPLTSCSTPMRNLAAENLYHYLAPSSVTTKSQVRYWCPGAKLLGRVTKCNADSLVHIRKE